MLLRILSTCLVHMWNPNLVIIGSADGLAPKGPIAGYRVWVLQNQLPF